METQKSQLENFLNSGDDASSLDEDSRSTDDDLEGEAGDEPGDKPAKAAPDAPAGQANGKDDAAGDEPEGDAKPGRERDASGKFKPKAVKPDETAAELERLRQDNERLTREAAGLRGASTAERARRKEAERKGFDFNDPDASLGDLEQRLTAHFDQRFYDLAEDHARSTLKDYDAVVDELMADCEKDPLLGRFVFGEVSQVRDPARKLYELASTRRNVKAYGDVGKYRESIEGTFKEKLATAEKERDELRAENDRLKKIPQSLANRGSSRPSGAASDEDDRDVSVEALTKSIRERKQNRKRRA